MKLSKLLITFIFTMFISTGILASNEDIKIKIDGVELYTKTPAKIVNNRTLVPMRAIFEALGGKVVWENDTKTVIGTKGSDKIILQVGNSIASINGKKITLDSPPVVINGITLVPIRVIARGLGSDVDWNNDTRTVIINSLVNGKIDDNLNIELEVLRLANIERSKRGLKEFKISYELSNLARMKSQDMADRNYFDHTSPTYGSPFDMMKQYGIKYTEAGENIAKGYVGAEAVMNGWMSSPGHKANILNSKFGTLGIGYIIEGGTPYWTQMFTN